MGQTNRLFKTKDGVNKAIFNKTNKKINRAIKKQKQELNDRVDALVNNMKTTHGTFDKTRQTSMNEYKNIMDSIKKFNKLKSHPPLKHYHYPRYQNNYGSIITN